MTLMKGTPILAGAAEGKILAADTPLSFWGGFDPATGEIIDRRHSLAGQTARGRILVIPSGKGSCSGSGVLLEVIHNDTAPAAIITSQVDPIIALGAVLGDELYAAHPVIIVVADAVRTRLKSDDWLAIAKDGRLTLRKSQE